MLGRFADMTRAATRHAAMLTYLNNAVSIGPNSPLGRRRGKGLNENHARELMELFSTGVIDRNGQPNYDEFVAT